MGYLQMVIVGFFYGLGFAIAQWFWGLIVRLLSR